MQDIYLDYANGQDAVNLETYLGNREYLRPIAFGKAILNNLDRSRFDAILDCQALSTETERPISFRDVQPSRYCRAERVHDRPEERKAGTICMAAPITTGEIGILRTVSPSRAVGHVGDTRVRNEHAQEGSERRI